MRSKRALLISILLAILAVFLMYYYTEAKIELYAKRFKQIDVVIASKDILPNTIIDESMLEMRKIPSPYVEPNAILDKTSRINYLSAITIREGEQLTEQKLLRPNESMSSYIPKGKRAVTIAINEITGVAGLVRKQDKVDIIGVFKTVDEKTKIVGNAESVTLLQNVEVLTIGRNYANESVPSGQQEKESATRSDVNLSNITLLLTPREAMDIALAQEIGNLTLTLRPRFDDDPPKIYPDLKNDRSKPSTVTGIKEKIDIAPGPKWLEQRGDKSLWVR